MNSSVGRNCQCTRQTQPRTDREITQCVLLDALTWKDLSSLIGTSECDRCSHRGLQKLLSQVVLLGRMVTSTVTNINCCPIVIKTILFIVPLSSDSNVCKLSTPAHSQQQFEVLNFCQLKERNFKTGLVSCQNQIDFICCQLWLKCRGQLMRWILIGSKGRCMQSSNISNKTTGFF